MVTKRAAGATDPPPARMPELTFLSDLIVLFGLGVAVVLACDRVRLPPIVGFLITGVLSGPYGFGLIENVGQVEAMAEIGVVLLLFSVGIEFSIRELARLRTLFLAGGSLQVGLTLALTTLLARAAGQPWRVAMFLGMLVALSSTAIVLRLLADRGETDSPHGRAALGLLVFQDLCIVPMVLLTPLLSGRGAEPRDIAAVALRAALFVGAAVAAARYVVPRLLHVAVQTRKREVFLLTVVLLCLGAAWASSRVGLSLALGAFIAGLTVSESEYSHQALGEILPLREVFNSLFFVSIGMLFDVRTVLAQPTLVAGTVVGVVVLKALVTSGVAWGLGQSLRVALVAGLALAQIGEFSFVLSKAGLAVGLLDASLNQLLIAAAVSTMAVTPLLFAGAPRAAALLEGWLPDRLTEGRLAPAGSGPAARPDDHVIIVGYGVNGRNLARVLGRVGVPFVVVDINPEAVRAERRAGRAILYGDATRQEVVEHAGVRQARILVIAISDAAATRASAALARRLNPQLHIVVRSRYVQEVEPLTALGVDEVVPEEFETSIEIFSRVLRRYLVPRGQIDELAHEVRQGAYEMFRAPWESYAPPRGLRRFLGDLSLEVYRVEPNSALAGTALGNSGLRERTGATVVAIQRESDDVLVNPDGSAAMHGGDMVLLLGRPEQLAAAAPLFDGTGPAVP